MYAIKFTFPWGGVEYAGKTRDGSLGFASTLATADLYESREIAERFLANGYGDGTRPLGEVIEVEA